MTEDLKQSWSEAIGDEDITGWAIEYVGKLFERIDFLEKQVTELQATNTREIERRRQALALVDKIEAELGKRGL